jgi:tRNA (guanosine-2'-O-)-methyltransferase|tara:strand:+ start:673 stop:1365 length:693 start_codon:yes stop_codon:yes gene_type:complete
LLIDEQHKKQLIKHLSEFITEDRLALFYDNLKQRTSRITIVLEDIFHSQNASAVLRTADCFGIQNIHIIENRNQHNTNPNVSLGSSKWLTETFYNNSENNTKECLQNLKKDGFRILATTPHNAKSIHDIDVNNEKIALLFGAEQEGLSDLSLQLADEKIKIPMYGFTESYNISVAAALCMQTVISKMRASEVEWQLTEVEKDEVLLNWLRNSIKESVLIEQRFIKEIISP